MPIETTFDFLDSKSHVYQGTLFFSENVIKDCVDFIELLNKIGIRFVFFSREHQLKSRYFAKKLGLDYSWNCYISLEADNEDTPSSCLLLTLASGLFSSNIVHDVNHAKLPRGIKNVRPHLQNVDDVPLQVHLFTDTNCNSVVEMMQIMQEYNEVVCVVVSCHNTASLSINRQADVCIQIVPTLHQNCSKQTPHVTYLPVNDQEAQGIYDQYNSCPSLSHKSY